MLVADGEIPGYFKLSWKEKKEQYRNKPEQVHLWGTFGKTFKVYDVAFRISAANKSYHYPENIKAYPEFEIRTERVFTNTGFKNQPGYYKGDVKHQKIQCNDYLL